jgi:2-polyprenyl-6-methoxyphenol hydroxylase-like FAD-dependent oxidoreductase
LPQPEARVLIVGAGIAGLCCGLALSRIGVDIEIIERVNEIEEVGSAISLWPSASGRDDSDGLMFESRRTREAQVSR